ncbi:DNA-methyltransferase [Candidatus Clostridium helianthi]|uniref:DNA-methyltransferase n=1 Tax=Candidatus Clostridium helianthi TaxID=3381660 RepID=A0ABW8SAL8_9CLOT
MSSAKVFHINNLFKILGIHDTNELTYVSRKLRISNKELQYYNDKMIFPTGKVLYSILKYTGYTEFELKVRLGIIDNKIIEWIAENPEFILKNYKERKEINSNLTKPIFETSKGRLYMGDCLDVMRCIPDGHVNMIFADPPFNLNKKYESGIDDYISEQEYINWTEKWILECIRILAPGGSMFVYNIPYWNTYTSSILNKYLNFRHWIAISMKGLISVRNKLHPEHYSLLYYIKGDKPLVFNKQRIPMATCRHCGGELRDYGGKKKDLDPTGLSVPDIFTDINPVRHEKYKNRQANELPVKLLYRIISMASNEGDIIFDPFGGSGTTYIVAEYLNRMWIGSEIGSVDDIITRFNNKSDEELLKIIEKDSNVLFTEKQIKIRKKNGFWGYEKLTKYKREVCKEN